MQNATTFGLQAEVYSSARPTYPHALFDWIADQAPRRRLAWDVGTGSGQAALELAKRFAAVQATDIDGAQIAQTPDHPEIRFVKAPAHASHLADKSVDAITVATALHWFDPERFWPEVRRVARADAIFCAWTYHQVETDQGTRDALLTPVTDVLAPYWSDGNRLSWRGYSKEELRMPFEAVDLPEFSCRLRWRPSQLAAFIRSWSAHQRARLDGHAATLAKIETDGLAKLDDTPREVVLPMHFLAARIR